MKNFNIMVFDDKSLSIKHNYFEFSYSLLKNNKRAIGFACKFECDDEKYKELQSKLENLAKVILKEIEKL
jgi:hypothetical protein